MKREKYYSLLTRNMYTSDCWITHMQQEKCVHLASIHNKSQYYINLTSNKKVLVMQSRTTSYIVHLDDWQLRNLQIVAMHMGGICKREMWVIQLSWNH
jgi:hypothetical protein